MRESIQKLLLITDIIVAPLLYPVAILLRFIRRAGVHRMPCCKAILLHVGVFPIRNHYYEPQFDNSGSEYDFSKDRGLPGIDLNVSEQLKFMEGFIYTSELEGIPKEKTSEQEFYLNNKSFTSGDAEYWYQIVRTIKPKRIIEIGSGNSTLMAVKAIYANHCDDVNYECEHICIEPYEMPWLEGLNVTLIREKVESVDVSFFSKLQSGDILFIDSSHMIRPHGDVLFEYLEVLPLLSKGVIVHVHDIFTPKNYLKEWLVDEVWFWNEQYLLEAFLTHNSSWKIIGALNYLHHNHYNELKSVAPYLHPEREPGSFYMKKTE